MPEEKLLTVKEAHAMIAESIAARSINRPAPSIKSLYRWLNEGKVFKRAQRIGLAGWLVPREEVERVLREENIF